MQVRDRPYAVIHDLAYKLLREPRPLDDLVDEIGGGLPSDDPRHVLETLLMDDPRVVWRPGDRFCRIDHLYRGVTFTHRLSEAEIERGVLMHDAEWMTLVDFFGEITVDIDKVDSAPLTVSSTYSEDDMTTLVVGLETVLTALNAGSLCGLVVTESGLALVASDEVEPTQAQLDAFAEAFTVESGDRLRPIDLADVIREAAMTDLTPWLDPVPPLPELAAAAGLQVRRGQVASPSFEWDGFMADAPIAAAAIRHGLSPSASNDLRVAVGQYHAWCQRDRAVPSSLGGTPPAVLLESPGVAEAFVRVLAETGDESIDDVALFANQVADLVDAEFRSGCRWVESVATARAGDVAGQERLLREALAAEPELERAGLDLGWLLFDGGNFAESRRWLEEAGSTSPLLSSIDYFTWPARSGAGRNDPCPCQSGMKFKRCHGGSTQPFADRLALLYDKAARPLVEEEGIPDWWTWPGDWRRDADADGGADADWRFGLDRLQELGVLIDILLSEGGAMLDFATRRADVLPPDELEVLHRWTEIRRGVWRVVKVDPDGDRATLEPADGSPAASVEVEALGIGDALEAGRLILARPLPLTDGTHRIFGGGLSLDEADLPDALALTNAIGVSPSETARRCIALADLHHDQADDRLVCVAVLEADEEELDSWAADHVEQLIAQSEGDVASLDPVPAMFMTQDQRFGLRLDNRISIVSISEEDHRELCNRLESEIPGATLVDERGVTLAVLRDEIDISRGPENDRFGESSDPSHVEEDEEETLTRALLREALTALASNRDDGAEPDNPDLNEPESDSLS